MRPLSLYLHIPFCEKKCPYCDFNSHLAPNNLPVTAYVAAVLADLAHEATRCPQQTLHSIFIGGGTPSLFPAHAFDTLLQAIGRYFHLPQDLEITLEANPGSSHVDKFRDYRALGINRISLGAQSFAASQLKQLGRIHSPEGIYTAVKAIEQAGFTRYNLDIMYALPAQSINAARADLQAAIALAPPHLSWYQLTLEPNTPFYKHPPPVPDCDVTADMTDMGLALLAAEGYARYEISAYSRGQPCAHNLNYWQFGDYLGLGAGAHGKLTLANGEVVRTTKHRRPQQYMTARDKAAATTPVVTQDLVFEYFLNQLRLCQPVLATHFTAATGIPWATLQPTLNALHNKELITCNSTGFELTNLGQRFLNDVQTAFLE